MLFNEYKVSVKQDEYVLEIAIQHRAYREQYCIVHLQMEVGTFHIKCSYHSKTFIKKKKEFKGTDPGQLALNSSFSSCCRGVPVSLVFFPGLPAVLPGPQCGRALAWPSFWAGGVCGGGCGEPTRGHQALASLVR